MVSLPLFVVDERIGAAFRRYAERLFLRCLPGASTVGMDRRPVVRAQQPFREVCGGRVRAGITHRLMPTTPFSNLLILAEMVEWPDLWPRLFNNLGYLVAFAVSIVFNFMLLLMSLSKSRRTFHKK